MTRVLVGLAAVVVATAVVLTVLATTDDPPEEAPRTVFVGDSITRGVSPVALEPSNEASWVTHAVADPRSPWALEANVAVPGDTLEMMRQRFREDVLDRDPEGVVILGGTNDVFDGVPVGDSVAALRRMVAAAEAAGIEVWLVAPPPVGPGYAPLRAELVAAVRELADERGVEFVDPTAALADDSGEWREGLSFDGIHLSEEGARRLGEAIVEEVSARGSG